MRGKQQDINITEEIIDKVLSQVHFAKYIFFTGGEPLLSVDKIEYLINRIIESKITVCAFGIVTNGTILDERVCKCFNRLSQYIKSRFIESGYGDIKYRYTGDIGISQDEFHNNTDTIGKALEFYRNHCNTNISISTKTLNKRDGKDLIVYSGNAKDLQANDKYHYKICTSQHRIQFCDVNDEKNYSNNVLLSDTKPIDNIFIKCPVEVAANGNFGISCDSSSKFMDTNSMGNVLDSSIAQMIDDWQWKHPILCKEDVREEAGANIINNKNNPNYNKSEDYSIINNVNLLENKRIKLHQKFKYLDFDEIYNITMILIELGDAEKANDLEKQESCKKQYRKYEKLNQEREVTAQFKKHEDTHNKFPNLTPKECIIMDNSIEQINIDWESCGYDKEYINDIKQRHMATIKDLERKNESRNSFIGLLKEAFVQ